jgi:transketolase
LNVLAQNIPWLVGGSADLATSNKTTLKSEGAGDFEAGSYAGRNFHFGVREHAMASSLNGMVLCKLRAFGGTFFNFTDYMRPSMRLAAIMEIPTVYVLTHDSIGLGEDGPTHQPVEQLASLRAMPNMIVMRPGDANEVAEAWKTIIQMKHNPVALVLSRQALPTIDRSKYAAASGVAKGGYVLADAQGGKPEVILIGTGSELSLCVAAYEKLTGEGVRARVVSMPSTEIFDAQDAAYKNSVLPREVRARVSVEAASVFGWERYVGSDGVIIGMTTFGASAPIKDLMKKFGFTTDKVIQAAKEALARAK